MFSTEPMKDNRIAVFREYNNGTPSDASDDYGAFVPAEAYFLTGAMFQENTALFGPDSDPVSDFQVIDPTRPNITGHTYMRKPFMMITADNEPPPGTGTGNYFDPVEETTLINDAPAYGVGVTGANHMTAVTTGLGLRSWDWPWYSAPATNAENTTQEEADARADVEDELDDFSEQTAPCYPLVTQLCFVMLLYSEAVLRQTVR